MSTLVHEMKEEPTRETYLNTGFFLKKRTALIICGSLIVIFFGSLFVTYFGKSCALMKTESVADKVINCQSLVCQHKSIFDGNKVKQF